MSKYLYGASIQGIQGYIFETNRLKEIVGASKIVEKINKIKFEKQFSLSKAPEKILQISGTIVLSFDNEEDVKKVVRNFIKYIKKMANGITISQAVIPYENYLKDREKLEEKLKIQRNKVDIPLDLHFAILKQNPRTAKPLYKIKKEKGKEVSYDLATFQKNEYFKKYSEKEITAAKNENKPKPIFDIEEISNSKNKIAVIYADGNGLGNLVKDMDKDVLMSFSKKLDDATKNSKDEAVKEIEKKYKKFKERTIILDGDDMTIICDASYALEFVYNFLEEFEKQTDKIYKNQNLTASAGIVYCNESFPLYYAVSLATDLCTHAKNYSREINQKLPPSNLMFHNVQSSYTKKFDQIIKDELTLGKEKIQCDFGPYYLKKQQDKPTIYDFINVVDDFRAENSPSSRLREWLTDVDASETYANASLTRINEIADKNWKSSNLSILHKDLNMNNLIVENKTPIYDILQTLSAQSKG